MATSRPSSVLPHLLLLLLTLYIPEVQVQGQEAWQEHIISFIERTPHLKSTLKELCYNQQSLFYPSAAEYICSSIYSPGPKAYLWFYEAECRTRHPREAIRMFSLNDMKNEVDTVSHYFEMQLWWEENIISWQCLFKDNGGKDSRPVPTEFREAGIPTVRLEADPPSPVQLNDLVTITCIVESFYPNTIQLVWLENGMEIHSELDDSGTHNSNRRFPLKRSLTVVATKQRDRSAFTCEAVYNAQDSVNATMILEIRKTSDQCLLSHLCLGLFLSKVVVAVFLLYFLQRKAAAGKVARDAPLASCCSGRQRGPTGNERRIQAEQPSLSR